MKRPYRKPTVRGEATAQQVRSLYAVMSEPRLEPAPEWQPIATAPCDDTWAMVRWCNGTEAIADLDHDSDPDWWDLRGATHWRRLTEAEMDAFYARMEPEA